jgi:tRNA G37 N-methylase Trm5
MKLGLLDQSRRIRATGTSILIPLRRRPSPEETGEMEKIARSEICLNSLPTCRARPLTLPELLQDSIPHELVPLLPASHDVVGDIIVLEFLNPDLLPYRKEIGSAFLKLNPGMKLPDMGIAVVHRSDGSGTTFIFTDYLSKV